VSSGRRQDVHPTLTQLMSTPNTANLRYARYTFDPWRSTSYPQFQPSKKKVATSNDSSFREPPARRLGIIELHRDPRMQPRRGSNWWERFHLYRDNITLLEREREREREGGLGEGERRHSYILNSIAFAIRAALFRLKSRLSPPIAISSLLPVPRHRRLLPSPSFPGRRSVAH